MKEIAFFILTAFVINNCTQSTSPPSDIILNGTFSLMDTTGQSSTQFSSGEEFRLIYSLTNNSKDTLTYYRGNSGPAIIFEIQKNDNVVASSVDGYAFEAIAFKNHLAPGKSLSGNWLAPTTPAQYPKAVLGPGQYKATVSYPIFQEAKVDTVSPIYFTVIE